MPSILLIDDDELFRSPLAERLRRAHWTVFEAEDGEAGLREAMRIRPDVILCDLLMPRINGFQVCRAVREQLHLRHTRIIVVTGRDYAADRKSAEDAGADDYLVKPIDLPRLIAVLTRIAPVGPSLSPNGHSPATPAAGASLRFWGVRGSIPSPGPNTVYYGGNTSCVELRADGELIILDAGSGIRPLGNLLLKEADGRPIRVTILLTHTHWDHIQGFPFFVPAYNVRNNLRVLGYEGASKCLQTTLAGQMESPYFPVMLEDLPSHLSIEELRDLTFHVGRVKVRAHFTNHPGVCVGYRLETSAGSIVYMPDNELLGGEHEASVVDFVRDADILIHDSQYTAEEYQSHVGWGHANVDDTVRLAMMAGVKRLFLFHHDPTHDDRMVTDMLIHSRNMVAQSSSSLIVDAARECEAIEMPPIEVPEAKEETTEKLPVAKG